VAGEPLTARQEAYAREHEAFEVSGVLRAWEQQRAELDAERLDLHGRAMGLSAGSEAGDLLELLADQHLDRDTKQAASAAAGTGAEIRACVEDEHGHVTSTDVPDDEAEFFTNYESDHDGLPQAVSDHPTRGTAQRALKDAYDEARIRGEAFHHRQAMRAAHEAIVPIDQDASSARPALLPPPPRTSGSAAAAARSAGIAPHPRGVGR